MYSIEVTNEGLFVTHRCDDGVSRDGPFDPIEFIKMAEQTRLEFRHTNKPAERELSDISKEDDYKGADHE